MMIRGMLSGGCLAYVEKGLSLPGFLLLFCCFWQGRVKLYKGHCRVVGSRSSQASGCLARSGCGPVYNLNGGIWAWPLRGFPVDKEVP